jgi:peptidoglycan/xylan/chitin deacetylase (PgdA/CDA1 family)
MKRTLLYIFVSLIFLAVNNFSQEVNTQKNKVAITIDDLPLQGIGRFPKSETKTIFYRLIDQIKEKRVPVTGFVVKSRLLTDGKYDDDKIDLLNKWLDAGLDLGNHTFSHPSANEVSLKDYEVNIVNGDTVLRGVIEGKGKELKYFRHPYLHTGLSLGKRDSINTFLKQNGYIIAPVTIDNSEWIFGAAYDKAANNDSLALMKKIGDEYINYMNAKFAYYEGRCKELFGRNVSQILLIHANRLNSDYLGKLCESIRSRGYDFVTLSEALRDEAYRTKDNFIKNNGISWIDRWALTAGKSKEFFAGEPRTPAYIMKTAGVDSE